MILFSLLGESLLVMGKLTHLSHASTFLARENEAFYFLFFFFFLDVKTVGAK